MKFLVDAQLPLQLAYWMRGQGHDAVHTKDLPEGNRTRDQEINRISLREERTVVTKDADFVDTLLLQQTPHRLLLISTGNISNAELLKLIEDNHDSIVSALQHADFVELGHRSLIVHR